MKPTNFYDSLGHIFYYESQYPNLTPNSYLTLNRQPRKTVNCLGNWLSTTSTSFENRDKTRPTGVVSKNANGNFKIFDKIYLCKTMDAWTQAIVGTTSPNTDVTAGNKNYAYC